MIRRFDNMAEEEETKRKICQTMNISQHMAKIFDRHGRLVARFPARYMLVCLVLVIGFGAGLYFLQWETNIVRLWNPDDSESGLNFKWLWKTHPPNLRKHSILFKSDNMLTKEHLLKMLKLRNELHSVTSSSGYSWNDVCLKVPYLPDDLNPMSSSDEDDPFADESSDSWDDDDTFHDNSDPLAALYPDFLCPMFNGLETVCLEDSILELFANNGKITENEIVSLTNQDIIDIINTKNISEIFSVAKDFRSMLGDIQYNETGHIVSAGVTSLILFGKMNVSEAHLNQKDRNVLGSQISIEKLDDATNEVEDTFIRLLAERRTEKHQNSSRYEESSIIIERNVQKDFQEAVNERIMDDIPKVLGSFLVMFVYVSLSLGKLNCFENRVYLACAGLVSVVFGMITSYGLCSYFGFVVSPLHNFIPFLLLGLGVDDMFVIVQTLDMFDRNTHLRQSSPDQKEYHNVQCQDNTNERNIANGTLENGEYKKNNQLEDYEVGVYEAPKGYYSKISVEEKIGEVMSHSGVSITITSLTDFIAFAIGGTTAIPALKSFCMFCGVGIVSVYIFQATWFVAWLVIDERRKQAKRNACLPFLDYKTELIKETYALSNSNSVENQQLNDVDSVSCYCSCNSTKNTEGTSSSSCLKTRKGVFDYVFTKYGEILSHIATQIIVVAFTIFILAISIYGNIHLKEDLDPFIFLPENNSVNTWMRLHKSAFPSKGELVTIFFEGPPKDSDGNFNDMNFTKFEWLVNEIRSQDDIVTNVDSWYSKYKEYYQNNFQDMNRNKSDLLVSNTDINNKTLVQFLFSQSGIKYKYLIDFDKELECGSSLPHINIHMMFLTHDVIDNSLDGINAMNRIKSIIKKANFEYRAFPFSPLYSVWEIDEIIRGELYRNLGLATIAIYFCTLILLSDFVGSLFCLLSVLLTLTNVSGLMYFWGLTIDTCTAIVLIICIGLSVDFAAHVVHLFMNTKPPERLKYNMANGNTTLDKNENDGKQSKTMLKSSHGYIYNKEKSDRMKRTLFAIAPAILHGGISTLLAVVLLVFSEVYVFVSFFKIFVLVVVFGLYNGLVFLPVLLANFGPNYKEPIADKLSKNVKPNQISLLNSKEMHTTNHILPTGEEVELSLNSTSMLS